jgi:hypothetical protein
MITNEQIIKIVDVMNEKGHAIRVLDISYILLCDIYEDKIVAYKSIFGNADEAIVKAYNESKMLTELRACLYTEGVIGEEDITFEENKRFMLKLKAETERAMANNEIEKKDALKILSDISVKLNDKFGAKEELKDQMVVVNCKYNSICESCGRELYIPTKEDLMLQYNLIEKK